MPNLSKKACHCSNANRVAEGVPHSFSSHVLTVPNSTNVLNQDSFQENVWVFWGQAPGVVISLATSTQPLPP